MRGKQQPAHKLIGPTLISAEYHMACATRSGDSRRRRDKRIPVSIAANPCAEPDRGTLIQVVARGSKLVLERSHQRRICVRAGVEVSGLEVPQYRT